MGHTATPVAPCDSRSPGLRAGSFVYTWHKGVSNGACVWRDADALFREPVLGADPAGVARKRNRHGGRGYGTEGPEPRLRASPWLCFRMPSTWPEAVDKRQIPFTSGLTHSWVGVPPASPPSSIVPMAATDTCSPDLVAQMELWMFTDTLW